MNPRTMSVHWLIALFLAGVALAVRVIAAYSGWRAASADNAVPWLVGALVAAYEEKNTKDSRLQIDA